MSVHLCSCGRLHNWESMTYVGRQEDGEGGWLEMRNCVCGSTRSEPVPHWTTWQQTDRDRERGQIAARRYLAGLRVISC